MNNIVNLPTIISRLSSKAKVDINLSRIFVKELFQFVEKQLIENKSVKIEGLGEFTRGLSKENPVLFRPDAQLDSLINEPFSAFQPVEVNNGAEKEINEDSETTVTIADEPAAPVISEPENTVDKPVDKPAEQPAEQPAEKIIEKPVEEPVTREEATADTPKVQPVVREVEPVKPVEDAPGVSSYEQYASYNRQTSSSSTTLWLILGILIGAIIGLIGGYFAGKMMGQYELPAEEEDEEEIYETQENQLDSEIPSLSDEIEKFDAGEPETQNEPTAAAEEKKPEPQPVYATVTSSLARLAGEHYGNKNYWVFIYQANPSLTNPNQIAPGTRVVIPPYESFAGATKEETNVKAQKILNELSKKYKL